MWEERSSGQNRWVHLRHFHSYSPENNAPNDSARTTCPIPEINGGGRPPCLYAFVTTITISGFNSTLMCRKIASIRNFWAQNCATDAISCASEELLCGKLARISKLSSYQCTADARGAREVISTSTSCSSIEICATSCVGAAHIAQHLHLMCM